MIIGMRRTQACQKKPLTVASAPKKLEPYLTGVLCRRKPNIYNRIAVRTTLESDQKTS